jgi:hypothetical protein
MAVGSAHLAGGSSGRQQSALPAGQQPHVLTYPSPPGTPVKDPRRVRLHDQAAIVLGATSIVARLPGSPASARLAPVSLTQTWLPVMALTFFPNEELWGTRLLSTQSARWGSRLDHRRTGQIWSSLAKRMAQGEQPGLVRTIRPYRVSGPGARFALRARMINCRNEAAWPSATGMLRVAVLFRGILWWRLKKSNAVWNSRRHR